MPCSWQELSEGLAFMSQLCHVPPNTSGGTLSKIPLVRFRSSQPHLLFWPLMKWPVLCKSRWCSLIASKLHASWFQSRGFSDMPCGMATGLLPALTHVQLGSTALYVLWGQMLTNGMGLEVADVQICLLSSLAGKFSEDPMESSNQSLQCWSTQYTSLCWFPFLPISLPSSLTPAPRIIFPIKLLTQKFLSWALLLGKHRLFNLSVPQVIICKIGNICVNFTRFVWM